MVEADWRECVDSGYMTEFIVSGVKRSPWQRHATDRKLRLCAIAFCRSAWNCSDQVSVTTLSAAEQYADGIVTRQELDNARTLVYQERGFSYSEHLQAVANCLLADAKSCVLVRAVQTPWVTPRISRLTEECRLIREILGNPFRPLPRLIGLTGRTVAMARNLYDTSDFAALPLLADALEEDGYPVEEKCPNCQDGIAAPCAVSGFRECRICKGTGMIPSRFLAHLRGTEAHARGCWALDHVLGLE